MKTIYLDYNSTTPLAPQVFDKMMNSAKSVFGNPSSVHFEGRNALKAIDEARREISELVGCDGKDLIFTSGGTEANNLALLGFMRAQKKASRHLITTSIEHKSVLEACHKLETEGVAVTFLPVDRLGRVDPDELSRSIRSDTCMISIMAANNEVGIIQNIERISEIAFSKGIVFHCDMVQALGKMPLELRKLRVDFATFSAHKIGGPKGIGALVHRRDLEIEPLVYGGKQGGGLRPGTENLIGIIGFGEAAKIKKKSLNAGVEHMRVLQKLLRDELKLRLNFVNFNGDTERGLPNTLSVSFPGCDIDTLLLALDGAGVAISVGSACNAGLGKASHVLEAMGLPKEDLDCTLRISLGEQTTTAEIHEAIDRIVDSVNISKLSEVV